MNQLLKVALRGEKIFIKNEGRKNYLKSHSIRTFPNRAATFFGPLICTNEPNNQHAQYKNSINFYRNFTAGGCSFSNKINNFSNYSDNNESRTILISKAGNRLGRKNKIRDALEERQRKIQRGMENALQDRRIALTNTRKRIQERGKLIIKDIKETKEKMKEKIEEVIERENVYTIPNLLCVTRIGLSPFLGYLIVSEKFGYALTFMVVAGVSDWVDGWIARNYKSQSSKIGSFLDPMADKVLIGTLFLSLTYMNLIPLPLTALIIGRDVILIISGFVIRYRSLPPPRTLSRYFDVTHATAQLAPTFISKVNTGVQLLLVATTLAAPVLGYVNHQYLQILWYVTATSTVVAASSYIFSKQTYKYLKAKEKVKDFSKK